MKLLFTSYTGEGVKFKMDTGEIYKVEYSRTKKLYDIHYQKTKDNPFQWVGQWNSDEQNKLLKIKKNILAGKYYVANKMKGPKDGKEKKEK